MKIIVNGRNIPLTDAIKSYVAEKLERLDHHFDFILEVHVFLGVEKNPRIKDSHTAEATVHVRGAVLRMEASSEILYASIDALVDKIDRGLKKHKTKLLHRNKSGHSGESIRRHGFEQETDTTPAERHDDSDLDLEALADVYYLDEDDELVAEEALSSASVPRQG
ncbi:MAG: ribosome-associated translation inhibitor RaiA [Candidatus Melainabacteria bacterium]|nr:ribosome-associated translation inhibitor RaiA [Candidatus Melainabacteria bacterium]